jgi:hypothetical protein
MMRSTRLGALLVVALAMAAGEHGGAQSAAARGNEDALRRQVERRFDLLPLRDGIALRPKAPRSPVRSIEITDGLIAIDGTPATGAELREKLGADADLVLRLSYLDPDARRALAGVAVTPPAPPEQEPPQTPSTVEPPAPPKPADLPSPPKRTRRSHERVRIGGRVNVEADEVVSDVVLIGGAARIDGQVTGDVAIIGGRLDLGPTAEVRGDVTVVGGTLHRDPAARVAGAVNQVGPGIMLHDLRFHDVVPFFVLNSLWGGVFSLMSTLVRCAVLCIIACLALLIGRDYVERIGARAAAEPVKAGLVGLLAEILLLPASIVVIVFLAVTIIGIPLIPVALLIVALMFVVGFTAVAYYVGRFVSTRFGTSQPNPYLTTVLGTVVLMSPIIVARIVGLGDGLVFPITAVLLGIGFMVEYVAWTVGFGAVALSRLDRAPAQPSAPAA